MVLPSARCTVCAESFYRPHAEYLATECKSCDAVAGVRCRSNTTTATLILSAGYWRHSTATMQTLSCRSKGRWSPCLGGVDAGEVGDGYCQTGYRRPRCEVCDALESSMCFDKLKVRCLDCGDVAAKTTTTFVAFVLVLVICYVSTL
eukprot:7370783-Prymnesium_polylepis.3